MEQGLTKQVETIMESFDFDKVHKHMVDTNWTWRDKIPTLRDLEIQAEGLLLTVIHSNDKVTNAGSGGFTAYKLPWGLKLSFEICSRNGK